MYTLSKAKEEIDAIANYALTLAEHAIAVEEGVNGKFESFKQEMFAHIDAKFAELQKAIVGEQQATETSAVSDLGTKVALLKRTPPAPEHNDQGHDNGGHHDQGWGGDQHHG